MLRSLISLSSTAVLSLSAVAVNAQTSDQVTQVVTPSAVTQASLNPDYCINALSDFPTDDHERRYQFFRLSEEMARDVTPDLRAALQTYSGETVEPGSSVLGVIQNIANPVLRQAAPQITVSNMTYVIDFAKICEPFISGQIKSLEAFDGALKDVAFNAVIVEDALFLRQILSDSLSRLGASEDPQYSASVNQYANALVITRDLKRSNDLINEEMDREVLGDSVALSDSMNKAEKKKAKERQLYTLYRILGGGG